MALSAAVFDYCADHAEAFLTPEPLTTDRGQAIVESSPLGVLFGVEAWNFPYYQIARFAAPNLMAGNVVMVKHASNVPQCALAFEQLMHYAGLPACRRLHQLVLVERSGRRADRRRASAWCGLDRQ